MRCSNCSAAILDGTPQCPQCGTVNVEEPTDPHRSKGDTDPGRPALAAPTIEQEAIAEPSTGKRNALRARLGAPRPAEPPVDDAVPTKIGESLDTAPGDFPAVSDTRPEPAPVRRPKNAPVAQRAPLKRVASNPGRPAAAARRRNEGTETVADTEPVPRNSRPKMSAAPRAGQPLVPSGKYAQYEDREPEGTLARPELQQQQAAAPPPVNPDEMIQAVLSTLKEMTLEDKLECFGCVGMIFMTFMPWREIRGEGDLGIITTAGFFSLLFAGAVMGLMYLRHTGRVPTLPAKLLSRAELGLAALQLPITLAFIVMSVDRHQTQFGSLTVYQSMPDFGAILSMLANFVAVAGAALVMQREGRRG